MDFFSRSVEIDLIDCVYFNTRTKKEIPSSSLKRIKSLGIPLAYKKLWLSKDISGKIQAVALDGKGKKQYFYSSEWIEERDDHKFQRMYKFSKALPKLMKKVEEDLRLGECKTSSINYSKKTTMAYMIKILDLTNIRIGNKKYLDQNESYGLTTLCKEHISFEKIKESNSNESNTKESKTKESKPKVVINFNGKHNVLQNIEIEDEGTVHFIKRMMLLPTEWIMKYRSSKNEEEYHAVSAQDLNNYMQETIPEFSCKDFRTYGANKTFIESLKKFSGTDLKKNVSDALELTADKLGNNKATSKKSYVMDCLIEKYLEDPKFIKSTRFDKLLKHFYG